MSTRQKTQFVDELPGSPYQSHRRTSKASPRTHPGGEVLADFADDLRENPMHWALWPRPITGSTAAQVSNRQREGFYRSITPAKGFECAYRSGTVYVRFNPERVAESDIDRSYKDGHRDGYKQAMEDLSRIVEHSFQYARTELRAAMGKEPIDNPMGSALGSRHPNAKLNEADVVRIRSDYSKGITQSALARRYGVSISTISDAVNRKRFAHVPEVAL